MMMSMAPRSPIDPDTREMLESLSDGTTSFFAEVLETFLLNVEETLERLEVACARGDRDVVRFYAHRFRSSSASIGALVLSALSAELERAAKTDDECLDAVWARVKGETAQVLSWVEVHRPVLASAS